MTPTTGENSSTDPVAAMMADDNASAMLGIAVTGYGPGWAEATMTIRPDMVNGHDIAHGGLIFTLADTTFACACNSHGPVTVAAGCEITFLSPGRAGDVLTARATERVLFGRSGIYDVTVRRGDEIVAEFRGRSHRVRQG